MAKKKTNNSVVQLVQAISFFKELQNSEIPGINNPFVLEILKEDEKVLQDKLFEALNPGKKE